MHYISDVATDPRIPWISGKAGSTRVLAEGVREEVNIRVVIGSKEGLVTGFPIPPYR
jgi:hypothetical protein